MPVELVAICKEKYLNGMKMRKKNLLPEWIPQISKPFNAVCEDTWNAMTPNEKRWSFLIDLVILVVSLSILFGVLI